MCVSINKARSSCLNSSDDVQRWVKGSLNAPSQRGRGIGGTPPTEPQAVTRRHWNSRMESERKTEQRSKDEPGGVFMKQFEKLKASWQEGQNEDEVRERWERQHEWKKKKKLGGNQKHALLTGKSKSASSSECRGVGGRGRNPETEVTTPERTWWA